jgi:hypothetical protein
MEEKLGAYKEVTIRINEKSNVEVHYPTYTNGCLKLSPRFAKALGEALIRFGNKARETWTVEGQASEASHDG